jgi:hypothetical protein
VIGVSLDFAKAQIARLSALNFFPTSEPVAVKEFVVVLQNHCLSEDHARNVVNEILGSTSDCPAPADIQRIAFGLRPDVQRKHCDTCGGSGWLIRELNGFEGAEKCECRAVAR